nr:MAG TPA: hypothetical protein [Caudoviricetes sp.]
MREKRADHRYETCHSMLFLSRTGHIPVRLFSYMKGKNANG